MVKADKVASRNDVASRAQLKNDYGHFDDKTGEYVITRPDTPTPWMNYIGEGRYGGIVSNAAGGYAFDRDPKNRRVTRYRYNAVPADQPGRYVYLRDMESGEYWSPTWQPIRGAAPQGYECRHGAGYTRIQSTHRGITTSLLYFVPPAPASESCPCELWVLKVKNTGKTTRKLRSFSYAEFSFWDTLTDQLNLDWGQHIMESTVKNGIIRTKTRFSPTTIYFASSAKPLGFDTDREPFIGVGRDLSNPIVVEEGKPTNRQAPRGNNIGSLCHDVVLKPGQEKEIVFIMGITDEPKRIDSVVARYSDAKKVDFAFSKLCADWRDYLGQFTVRTPDAVMNAVLNVWNPIQCRSTLYWSRFVSGYETGTGRGMGTRDSAQDTMGTVHAVPDTVKRTLNMLWRLQFPDGHTWHQVMPLTGEGGPGLAGELPDYPQWFSDDHLWLILAVCNYLRETGDFDYLEESVPYWQGEEDTIYGHMLRAVDFTLQHRGPQGLPRTGFSDWDDTMNLDRGSGKSESVWCAEQFCRAMLDFADLADAIEKPQDAERFRGLHAEMAEIINRVAWDGAWYARAYDDDGVPVGVNAEKNHKINLISQAWAVIADVAPPDRAQTAMLSADAKLGSPFGLALLWPSYTAGTQRVRGTSTYPPGAKENGGIFCHSNTWAIVAAAKLGWADRALDYYHRITPLARPDDVDVLKVDPYVHCGNITGPEHKSIGYARNAWLSGTAAWIYVAATQWILGIRPTFQGLEVAPRISVRWPGFTAKRIFRGVTYDITVTRKKGSKGHDVSLTVDGRPVPGSVVPLPPEGTESVRVEVELG